MLRPQNLHNFCHNSPCGELWVVTHNVMSYGKNWVSFCNPSIFQFLEVKLKKSSKNFIFFVNEKKIKIKIKNKLHGLVANPKKSLSFNAIVSQNGKKLTIILKFNERALPIRYLGVPIVIPYYIISLLNLTHVFCWENYLIKRAHETSFSQYVWASYGMRGGLTSYPLLLLGGFN